MSATLPEPARLVVSTRPGSVGLAWTARGFDRVVAPGPEDRVRADLAAAAGDRPEARRTPPELREAVARLKAHLDGRSDPLRDLPLDLSGQSPFAVKVLRALRKVPPGTTTTYGELARRAGRPGAARAVGSVMAANPVPLLAPCHRVLPASGGVGAYSARGGARQKEHLLQLEGRHFDPTLAAGLAHLSRRDRRLGAVVRRFGPYAPGFGGRASWDVLATSIVHQQLSVKAAGTIAARVRALTPGDGFPTPRRMARLDDGVLRGCGLSRAKVSFLRDLAERIVSGRLDLDALEHLDDDAVLAALTEVKGIGEWTAQMSLIFHLGRLDVWPVGDLGLRKAVQLHLGLAETPDEREMEVLGERWAPYRSMAAWYLWALIDGQVI